MCTMASPPARSLARGSSPTPLSQAGSPNSANGHQAMMRYVGHHRKRKAHRTVAMPHTIPADRDFRAAAEGCNRLLAAKRHPEYKSPSAWAVIRLDFHSGRTV